MSGSPPLRPRSLASRLGALIAASTLALGLLEGAVRLGDLAARQRTAAAQAASSDDGTQQRPANVQLHPFLGYAQRPGTDPTKRFEVEDVLALTEEDFVVAILGGSVAAGVARTGGDALKLELERRQPELEGSIKVVDLGMGGYKQPQQLIQLSLLLLLDVPIDVAINLDGFNELALSAGNSHFNVHPLLPHHGQMARVFDVAGGSAAMADVELTAEILRHRRRIESVRGFLDRHPGLRRSEALKALVGIAITTAEDRAVAAEARLEEASIKHHAPSIVNLPDPCLGDALACGHLVTGIWAQASKMMAALAAQHGVLYLHALQPNQYVEGSKSLTAEERNVAFAPRNRWSRAAALGYGDLRRAGQELRAAGVDFHDLTQIFSERSETIYKDVCCHYNDFGYRIVAERLAALVSASMRAAGG